jgi:hypothetical protein
MKKVGEACFERLLQIGGGDIDPHGVSVSDL